jgi:hypothetical protein
MPDVSGYAAANGLEGKSDDEIRDAMGDATAQKTFDHTGAPRSARKWSSDRLVQLNSHCL